MVFVHKKDITLIGVPSWRIPLLPRCTRWVDMALVDPVMIRTTTTINEVMIIRVSDGVIQRVLRITINQELQALPPRTC